MDLTLVLAVAKGKYGTHMYDLSVIQAMSDAFIIVWSLGMPIYPFQ